MKSIYSNIDRFVSLPIIRFWPLLFFLSFLFFFTFSVVRKKEQEQEQLLHLLLKLDEKIEIEERKRKFLLEDLQREESDEYKEGVLMKELGVIPKGWKKILLCRENE